MDTAALAGKTDVVCLGILVADFFPNPIARFPNQGELMTIDSITLSTGGCAANTAGGLNKLGISTGIVGKIGTDVFGRFIREDLQGRSIDTSGISVSQKSETSKTIIITIQGEDRRYLHLLGSNADFRLEDIDLDYISASKVLYIGGFLGMADFGGGDCKKVLEHAKKHGIITVLDVITPQAGEYLPLFKEILPLVDYFFPNDDEARLICGEEQPEKQAECFLELGAGTVVVTSGSQGLIAKTGKETVVAGCYSVPFVDGSGAGDAFDAGFIYALLEGKTLKEAVSYASAMGASCVRRLGCLAGLFTPDELVDFVSTRQLPG